MPGGDRDFCTENRRRRRRKGLVAWGEALWNHAAKGTPREVSPRRRRREKQRGAALLRTGRRVRKGVRPGYILN